MDFSDFKGILSGSIKDSFLNFMDKILLNNSSLDYLKAFILFLIFFLITQLFRGVLKV
jgi:hypothetical protein